MHQPEVPIPLVRFTRAMWLHPDPLSLVIVLAVAGFTLAILSLPLSSVARDAALRRFQLTGWGMVTWAVFQPTPSMYNFENEWEVTFSAPVPDECRRALRGAINHHVFNTVLLRRGTLERCGLPADIRYRSEYRGTAVETRYRAIRGPGIHGFMIVPRPR